MAKRLKLNPSTGTLTAAFVAATVPDLGVFDFSDDFETQPPTADEDGRVRGFVALHGTCHVGHRRKGLCVTPPISESDWAFFERSLVAAEDGTEAVAVGRLTVGGAHAPEGSLGAAVAAHDDMTTWALVAVGSNETGIWVSGIVDPEAPDDIVEAASGVPVSGDWRAARGHLELVEALTVPPGMEPQFPVEGTLVASGLGGVIPTFVQGIGMLRPETTTTPCTDAPTPCTQTDDSLQAAWKIVDAFSEPGSGQLVAVEGSDGQFVFHSTASDIDGNPMWILTAISDGVFNSGDDSKRVTVARAMCTPLDQKIEWTRTPDYDDQWDRVLNATDA